MASDRRLCITTFPNTQIATDIARALVGEKLAACVNLVPGHQSVYRWQGEICEEAEVIGLVKTTQGRLPELQKRLVELHPYECPEFVALDVSAGYPPYLDWIKEQVS